MNKLISLVLLVHLSLQQVQLQLSSHPDNLLSLGILIRVSSFQSWDKLNDYLDNLITPKCQVVAEFNILWSDLDKGNTITKLQKSLQKYTPNTPINIYSVPPSQRNFRFRIPEGSEADIYYFSDFNFNDSCKDITDYYREAQKYESAGLIPLIGESKMISTIKVDLASKRAAFKYERVQNQKHFALVQNIRLVSKHILELVQSRLREISLMGNSMNPVCQQIYINFITAHFYPELKPKYMNFNGQLRYFVDGPAQKSVCVQQFINILGYCPLFYQRTGWRSKNVWSNPNSQKILQLKRQQIERVILHKTRKLQATQPLQSFQFLSVGNIEQSQSTDSQLSSFEESIMLSLLSCIMVLLVCLRTISQKLNKYQVIARQSPK